VDKFLIYEIARIMKIFNADNTSNEIDLNVLNGIKISHIQNEEQLMKTSPQSAILNKIETWRDQQNKDSKRGKYLRICPDVDSNSEQASHYIKNFSVTKRQYSTSTKYFGSELYVQKYMCIRCCGQQSLLLVGFRDWITYHDYVNNASTPVLNFVKMVSKHGTSHKSV